MLGYPVYGILLRKALDPNNSPFLEGPKPVFSFSKGLREETPDMGRVLYRLVVNHVHKVIGVCVHIHKSRKIDR